jgi:hypothetical protein
VHDDRRRILRVERGDREVNGPFLFFRARSIENTTSAAVSGFPSENFTPGRSLNVKVFLFGLTV